MLAPTPPPASPATPWRKVLDAGTGRFYYVHSTTRETTWELPAGALQATASPPLYASAPVPAAAAAVAASAPVASRSSATAAEPDFLSIEWLNALWQRLTGSGKRGEEGVELLDVERGGVPAKAKGEQRFWAEHADQIKELLPFLWPKGELKLRLSMVAAFSCLLLAKLWSILVPLMLKAAVDKVANGELPVKAVILYGLFRFLGDATKEARDSLFASSSAYAARMISLRVFNHVQTLSLRFHLNRKTGAVLRAVNRGSQSFADLLRYISFQILPIFLEVGIVSIYLFANYDWPFGVITLCVMITYVALTIGVTEWRNQFRRRATEAEDAFSQQAVDSLLNFETVLLFNAESHVSSLYDKSLHKVADASLESQYSLSVLNVAQNGVISLGVTLVLWLASVRVLRGSMTVGDFILVQAFILQLYAPLGFLGTYWRMIKAALVDVEAMFKLMKENKEVVDEPDATSLVVGSVANVQFQNVVFTFEPARGPLLKGVSLEALSGRKLAIVGSSGAGKSTLSRLLFRLYNVESGRILIAGQDISRCTMRSVRLAVAIVPQDTVLFNDTLRYNVSLGKLARGELASEAEVMRAVDAAQLTSFLDKQPKRLETLVGERGLRLSGGEKQRVAIARALLKAAPIMVGDEATSALDSHTESEIMAALDSAATGRTYIVIAHRLSTIADADTIAVLHEGVIAELGAHAELLALGGLYSSMWARHMAEAEKTVQIAG